MARRNPRMNETPNSVVESSEKIMPSKTKMTYSTRFDEHDRGLIDQAAKSKNWTPAKLIREAAISSAADIINSSDDSSTTLKHLARLVAKQMLEPGTFVHSNDDPDRGITVPEVDFDELDDLANKVGELSPPHEYCGNPEDEHKYFISARASSLETKDQLQIQDAFETCGNSFSQMILEACLARKTTSATYKPKVKLSNVSYETEALEESSPQDV